MVFNRLTTDLSTLSEDYIILDLIRKLKTQYSGMFRGNNSGNNDKKEAKIKTFA